MTYPPNNTAPPQHSPNLNHTPLTHLRRLNNRPRLNDHIAPQHDPFPPSPHIRPALPPIESRHLPNICDPDPRPLKYHTPLSQHDDAARAVHLGVRMQDGSRADGDGMCAGELRVLRDQSGWIDGD